MLNNMNFRQIQEMQKINRIKQNNDYISCEVIITEEFKEPPVSIIQGNVGNIEIAMLIKCLNEISECMIRNFPETKKILPLLEDNGAMQETYKEIKQKTERIN